MYTGHYVFYQLTSSLSRYEFQKCVDAYHGDHYVKSFSCWQQFLCLCFGQLTFRESLRSIILCLNVHPKKLYHLGLRTSLDYTTLSRANNNRDWRIYQAFGYHLIRRARKLYQDDATFLDDLHGTFYALDATTVDLCLSVFKWAHFRESKGAVKIHVLLDLRGQIPAFIHITDGLVHDVNVLDALSIEPGACYLMDRGYIDYRRLFTIHQSRAFFIVRAKQNVRFRRIYSYPVDKSLGLRCDQTIYLTGYQALKDYPEKLRRVKYYDDQTDNTYVFLTDNFDLDAKRIADLYKQRWQIELFFKWIKGHLKVKVFWGQSENAVKTQIWVAICTYVMVAIIKKQFQIDRSMYEILQILSVTPFEKIPLNTLLSEFDLQGFEEQAQEQLSLLDF
jgi:transposase